MALHLQVLGPIRIRRGNDEVDPGPRQQRVVLALLLARAGRPIGMTELIELLWGPDAPASAVNVIHKYVGSLRRLLEPGLPPRAPGAYLARHGNGYRFAAGAETLDLARFRELVAGARAHAGREEFDAALDCYAGALRLAQGPAGEGLAETAAARSIFASLDGELSDAVVAAARIADRLGQPARLLGTLRQAAERDPLNELVQAALVTTLAAAGHQAEALAVYRSVGARLADELGVDPGRELQEAQQRVLTPFTRPAQLPPDPPYFGGREPELAALHRLAGGLRDDGRRGPLVVAIDGPSGSGKSALAVSFAHRIAVEFPDGQLYLDLRGDQRDTVPSLLFALGLPASEVPGTADAQVGAYRSLTAGRRLLILLDNVRNAAAVRSLLPSSPASLVLVTSRSPLLELAAHDGAHLMRVGVLDQRAAREMLERRLPGPAGRWDDVIEACGRQPFALARAAARLRFPSPSDD
jgi:DNA-binding SARP family transcriptional activator